MASIFKDDFNSYAVANLDTQGDWIKGNAAGTDFQVISGTAPTNFYEGTRGVFIESNNETWITKIGSAITDGVLGCYVKQEASNVFDLRYAIGPGSAHGMIELRDDANIYLHWLEGIRSIGTYSANTWYYVQIEWRSSPTHDIRGRVDLGVWSDWLSPMADWVTSVDRASFYYNGGHNKAYFDYIDEHEYGYVAPSTGRSKNLTLLGVA